MPASNFEKLVVKPSPGGKCPHMPTVGTHGLIGGQCPVKLIMMTSLCTSTKSVVSLEYFKPKQFFDKSNLPIAKLIMTTDRMQEKQSSVSS